MFLPLASPSFGRLQVAKIWESRRKSIETGRLLSTPGAMNRRTVDFRRPSFSMQGQNVEELIKTLETSTDIFDQADILHFLFDK